MAPYLSASGEQQKFHRRVAEVARVFGVERNRVGAAQFVAEVLVNEGHLDAELFQARGQQLLHQAAKFDFAQAQMAVVVADDFAETFQLSFGQRLDQTLVRPSIRSSPSASTTRPYCEPSALRLMMEPMMMSQTSSTVTCRLRNSSEMMESVAAAALPMPSARCPAARPMLMMRYQREVVRASSIRLRTMLHAVVPRGFEAERRRRAGQRQIVVNRLGHVRDLDFAIAALGRPTLAENAVSSPPMVTSAVMPSLFEHREKIFHVLLGLGRIRARGAENRAALEMDVPSRRGWPAA